MAVMSVGRYTIPELYIDRSAGEMTNHAKPLRSERRRRSSVAALAVALCLGLTACGVGDTGGAGASAGSVMPSEAPSSSSASPSPTSTLSPEEQEAFEQATETVAAHSQTILDLYSGTRTDVNDMYLVATGDLLQQEMQSIATELARGLKTVPTGVQSSLVSSEPVSFELDRQKPRVVIRACIDERHATDVEPDGTEVPGVREELDYEVLRINPAQGWRVSRVTGHADPNDRAC